MAGGAPLLSPGVGYRTAAATGLQEAGVRRVSDTDLDVCNLEEGLVGICPRRPWRSAPAAAGGPCTATAIELLTVRAAGAQSSRAYLTVVGTSVCPVIHSVNAAAARQPDAQAGPVHTWRGYLLRSLPRFGSETGVWRQSSADEGLSLAAVKPGPRRQGWRPDTACQPAGLDAADPPSTECATAGLDGWNRSAASAAYSRRQLLPYFNDYASTRGRAEGTAWLRRARGVAIFLNAHWAGLRVLSRVWHPAAVQGRLALPGRPCPPLSARMVGALMPGPQSPLPARFGAG